MQTEDRLRRLEQQVARLTQLLADRGIEYNPWKYLSEAGRSLGLTRHHLKALINTARMNPKQSDLKNNVHYRYVGRRWQINVDEFQRYLSIPLEQRKGA